LVGAAYALDRLDRFENFARKITWTGYWDLLDFPLLKRDLSGLVGGEAFTKQLLKLMEVEWKGKTDISIEDLQIPYGAVATDLKTGKEIWFTKGSLVTAVRASCAIPGIITPLKDPERSNEHTSEWLIDGGMSNPVPVNLCRALGADFVIAVNLNNDLVARHFSKGTATTSNTTPKPESEVQSHTTTNAPSKRTAPHPSETETKSENRSFEESLWKTIKSAKLDAQLLDTISQYLPPFASSSKKAKSSSSSSSTSSSKTTKKESETPPHFLKVIATTIGIMQQKITRMRLSSDPPDIELSPKIHLDAFDWDKAAIGIEDGRKCVAANLQLIKEAIERFNSNK